jgi:adenine-specific DNA-methyltransferase
MANTDFVYSKWSDRAFELESFVLRNKNEVAPDIVAQPYPHFIKYMGSKSKIMPFVLEGLNEVYDEGALCDLFAGSASLAGAVRQQVAVHSNDIQAYSGVLANAYLESYQYPGMPIAEDIVTAAEQIVFSNASNLGLDFDYKKINTIDTFNAAERAQQKLIERKFDWQWHFFTKTYSGTWWSVRQCLWIDALREVAETYKDQPCYSLILSSLMYAMAYTSQGTGHYAQYRDANTESGMNDISIYRKRDLEPYFIRKYNDVVNSLSTDVPVQPHKVTSLDFRDCLAQFSGGTVYADPPYCFVHYSRFYHALETLVLYDNPLVQQMNGTHVKGRYRETRHQSPFCIKTKVQQAFLDMFDGVNQSRSNLALSYSNTGMITIERVHELAKKVFSGKKIELLLTDHTHMTMGRKAHRSNDVSECLILIK